MMSTTELDPTILKALGYFRSNHPDSTEKLKAMLTESVESSKRGFESKSMHSFEKSSLTAGRNVKIASNPSDPRKRDVTSNLLQKRPFDKVHDSNDFGADVAKKRFFAGGSSSLIETSSTKVDILSSNGAFRKSSPISPAPPGDFELEIAGLACTVCKEMTVGSGNQLVECQDCHSLYHQDCHQPHVTDKDMNDPRRVWYCAKCKQKMKQENTFLSAPSSRTTTVNSLDLPTDKTKNKPKPTITPFKRSELKTSLSSSSTNSAAPLSGWAPLSGKTSLTHKFHDEFGKSSETKVDNPSKKSSSQKDKTKSKNHSKNLFVNSDAWAEALGAKSSNDKHKMSSKGASSSNNAKHATLSSASPARLSASGSNPSSKQKPYLNSVASHKSAPFPKTSAASGSVTKSMSTHDSAAKQMQLMKKKAAAKLQQKKHARI